MSRFAVLLLVAAFLLTAPGVGFGDEEEESSSQTSAAQSEQIESCAVRSEATSSGESGSCPARSQAAGSETPQDQKIPVYVPPNRGAPPTRIGGASRGGTRPVRKI